jgi:hypothetical protein
MLRVSQGHRAVRAQSWTDAKMPQSPHARGLGNQARGTVGDGVARFVSSRVGYAAQVEDFQLETGGRVEDGFDGSEVRVPDVGLAEGAEVA